MCLPPSLFTYQIPTHAYFKPCDPIEVLLDRNEIWRNRIQQVCPDFCESLKDHQSPYILWIGCSDSRVPETTILDLLPGEVFVHRNIANLVPENDTSSQSVIQFGVQVLKVKHIIVAGHYDCGGIKASLSVENIGPPVSDWLANIRPVISQHQEELDSITDLKLKAQRLVELNVIAQYRNIMNLSYVIDAQQRGLQVHAWIYDVGSGKVKALEVNPL